MLSMCSDCGHVCDTILQNESCFPVSFSAGRVFETKTLVLPLYFREQYSFPVANPSPSSVGHDSVETEKKCSRSKKEDPRSNEA